MTKDIDAAMNSMPPGWKSRWCNSHMCACMGCANKAGGLTAKGYTYQDWRDWISRNKEDYMNGLSPIKEVKWSMEPKEMTINLEEYIGKTVEVELRNGDVWTGHKIKLDKLIFNQFKYLIGGGSDYYHKFGQHHQCNLYDIVKIRVLKPDIIPHGQEKKMLDEKGHIQCEIEELKIEMQKHIDALKNCTKLVEKNNEKLRKLKMEKEKSSTEMTVEELQSKNWYVNMSEMRHFIREDEDTIKKLQNNNWKIQMKNASYPMLEVIDENTVRIEGVKYQKVDEINPLPKPPTLLEIIRDWNDDEDDPPCEVLVDMISDAWIPDKLEYEENDMGYNQGWNDCLDEIKENLK